MTDLAAPMLELCDLSCGYGTAPVLRGVNLALRQGELACLIGPNGAGKSTLTKAVVGQLKPRAGSIRFAGADITSEPVHARARLGIALVPEGRGVLPRLSVEDNLRLGGYTTRAGGDVTARVDDMMTAFPILRLRREQIAGTLSGGEQQQLVIARALLGKPRLLILDEPSLGLAPLIVRQIFDIIAQLHGSGLTILLIEQNAHMALKIAQRGYVMEQGELVLEASAADLRGNALVKQIYLGAG